MQPPVDILLVDDEARNLDALEAILGDPPNPGYRLLRAENADQALRLLLDHHVAVIVLDIKMPGVSGFELAQIIKNTKRFRETPVVFLTAYMVGDQDVVAGYGAGGVDYLTKPVNPQILRQKVAVFADLHRKTRELAELNEKLEERVKERTAELEKSEAALRASAHQKDEFLAVLAHELRNPLAPLRTGLDLLIYQLPAEQSPGVGRTLAAMNRQLDHMVRLIDDLLDVSRISRGLLELKRERLELAPMLEATLESARPWFEKRRQTLVADLPAAIFAQADQTRIAQIITNLLHNATKFTPEGGTIRVELTRELASGNGDQETAVVRVSDSGVGIALDQLECVFEMFTRIDRHGVGTEPGLGIGLALARRLAEMHGGKLTVTSQGEGQGATFALHIPDTAAKPAAASGMGQQTQQPGNVPAAPSTPEKADALHVVVVEDNDDVGEILVYWLEELGHRVTLARTGTQGVASICDGRPDVVFCDLGIPELDGLEVCRRVRAALPAHAQPVMVALTGWGRDDDLKRTREAGFDHHLVKPVAPEKLRTILQGVAASKAKLALQPDSSGPSLGT